MNNKKNQELLEQKTQLSIKQSKELIRLRKELQENQKKNRKLLQENDELKVLIKHWRETSMSDSQEVEILSEIIEEIRKKFQIDYIIDEQTGKRYYRSNKLLDYKEALESIKEIVSEPCNIAEKTCKACKSNCEHKDILNIIKRVEEQ